MQRMRRAVAHAPMLRTGWRGLVSVLKEANRQSLEFSAASANKEASAVSASPRASTVVSDLPRLPRRGTQTAPQSNPWPERMHLNQTL